MPLDLEYTRRHIGFVRRNPVQLIIIIPLVHIHFRLPRPAGSKAKEHADNRRAIKPGVAYCDRVESRHLSDIATHGEAA
jgi:hypothetical protein